VRDSTSRSIDVLIVEDSAADAELIVRELHGSLDRFTWRNKPVVLEKAVSFVELLKAVAVLI
jgi:hypothetical protein